MIPGFEQALYGLAEDEEQTFPLTFPADYGEASLAGQPVEFTVTLRELRVPDLPEADDDFAQSVGSFRDLAHLQEDIGAAPGGQRPRSRASRLLRSGHRVRRGQRHA